MDQIIILGAGLDTRAHRLPPDTPVRCFEIDVPPTQAFQRDLVAGTGLDSTEAVYVPVGFRTGKWFTKVLEAGSGPDQLSFFL